MLTLGEQYIIHRKDIKMSSRIGKNILGSLVILTTLLFFSLTIYDVCTGRGIKDTSEFIFVSVFLTFFSIFSIYLIYRSYFPNQETIRIGSEGIIDADGKVYPWNKVEYAFLKRESKSHYLHIYYKDDSNQSAHDSIYVSEFDVHEDEVADAIEGWCGRDIGHYEDYEKDNYIKSQVEEGKKSEAESKELDEKLSLYTPYFQKLRKEYKMYFLWLAPIFIISYLLSSLLCDVDTPMDKSDFLGSMKFISLKAGGFFLYMLCLALVYNYKTKKLRQNPDLKDLSDKELNHLLTTYDIEESSLTVKVLLIPVVIWLLFVIYTLSVALGVL